MPVTDCPSCGLKLNVKEELVGQRLRCPTCGATFACATDDGSSKPGSSRQPEEYPSVEEVQPVQSGNRGGGSSREADRYEEDYPEAPEQSSARRRGQKYCHECGEVIRARAVICPKCGMEQPRARASYPGNSN